MRHQAHAGKALTDVRRLVAVDTHGRRGGRRRLIPADFVLAAIGIPLLGLATCGRPHRCRRSSSLDLKQAGVGLAVAVLIGPTVIRSVLLEAVIAVPGECTGCLPRRLPWLPRLGLDAPAAPEQATAARPAVTAAPGHRRPIKIPAAGSGGEGPQPSECVAAGAAGTTLSRPESGVTGTTADLSVGCRFGGAPIDEWVEADEPRLPAGGR